MCKKLLFLTTLILLLGSISIAEDIQWTGAGRNKLWSTTANWDLGRAPTLNDGVRIEAPAATAPNGPVIQEGIDAKADLIWCENPGEPTLTMTGGTLEIGGWGVWWGDGADSFGFWDMSGGTVDFTGSPGIFEFGWGGGAGTLTMTGGTVNAKGVTLPTDSGAYGHIFLDGGTLNIGTERGGLNMNANGLIDINDGTLVLEGDETVKVNDLFAAGLITALGGEGILEVDYDVRNPGKTTVTGVLAPSVIEPVKPSMAGLVAYYAMENDANDSSGNEFHGTMVGDPVFAEGPVGMAMDFDGDGDYVDCGNDPAFSVSDAITISLWVNIRAIAGDWRAIIAKGDSAWRISNNGSTQGIHFGFTGSDRDYQAVNSATELPFDEWHHVCATYDITVGGHIYIDGMVDGENPDTLGITTNDQNVFIGNNSENPDRFWDGLIDEVRIYSRGLSAGEAMYLAGQRATPVDPGAEGLVAHYEFENNVDDSSSNGLHGTIVGDPEFVEGPPGFGMAMDFDGDGDYVDCGNPPEFTITNQISFAYWIKVRAFDRGWNTVIAKGDDSWRSSRAGENNFMEAAVGGTSGNFLYGVTPVDDEQWHHVAAVYNGAIFKLYVDGGLDGSEESTGQIAVSSHNVAIGENLDQTGRYWNGQIDDVVIYNRALSVGEVSYLVGNRISYTYDGDAAIAGEADDHDSLDGSWDHNNGSDQWDGTGPGEGNPGGAAALVEDDVTFLRIQDIGNPQDLGISDPSNRKVYFTHRQTGLGLDGVNLEVRLRVATTPPLDNQISGDPWPAGGIGYHIRDGGKGMFGVSDGTQIISFSLAKAGEEGFEDVATDVLVMNNLVGAEASGDVDTSDAANATAMNMLSIEDATQWNTFVINIVAGGAGTHIVSVSANDGPVEVFEVTTGTDTEEDVPFITIGSSGTGGITAFDVDYISVSN